MAESNGGINTAPAVQAVTNGPVAQSVKSEKDKMMNELSNLSTAKTVPSEKAATGQPLTAYHGYFEHLLSWNDPRATAITFTSIVTLIIAVRYLDVVRWGLKIMYMVLGITIAAEMAGKMILSNGIATQMRPRTYYTLPRETIDGILGDIHELVNFVVLEAQRLLFAEDVVKSAVACVGAFLSYYLVKIVPYWGLALIATCFTFLVPLIYKTNQELIDHHVSQASKVLDAQTTQLKQSVSTSTSQLSAQASQYVGDYTSKASQLLRGRTTTPAVKKGLKDTDFPEAPKQPFKTEHVEKNAEREPLMS